MEIGKEAIGNTVNTRHKGNKAQRHKVNTRQVAIGNANVIIIQFGFAKCIINVAKFAIHYCKGTTGELHPAIL